MRMTVICSVTVIPLCLSEFYSSCRIYLAKA